MTKSPSVAKKAFDSHDWSGVLEALQEANDKGELSPEDLLLLADALWWTGQSDQSLEAFEKAFSGLVDEDKPTEAGRVAALLAYFALRRQAFAVAGGWIARAEGLLDDQPESVGHVWLKMMYMGRALFVEGDVEATIHLSDVVLEAATSAGFISAQSVAKSFKAIAMIQQGEWRDGVSLLDEAASMAIVGGDDLRMTSDVYCNTIAACRNLGDYERAAEWTEEAERWMHSNSVRGYTGACQVHRAELKRLHGSWLEAEDEARRACSELERFHITDYLGAAHYEIGEVRRRMGDFDAAAESFERAYENGHDAQPGLSLLMLDRGEVEEAAQSIGSAAIARSLDDRHPVARGPSRARLLPAQIEIALAMGDEDLALSATDDLEEIAQAFESQVWKAAVASSRGALLLHDEDHGGAVETLGRAWRMWQKVNLPYEMARTRVQLGEARLAEGNEAGARLEFKAALSTLEHLGATTDSSRVRALLGDETPDAGKTAENRVTRTFMFTDIVTSTDLIGLIGDASWQELLRWHDRTLRSAVESAGGEDVRHTGDGFFVSFDDPRTGVECAVDIQRRLAKHRSEHGFAPLVRIGLHRAEATRTNDDYSGGGVHVAARIGALAEGEEIVASADVLAASGPLPFPVSKPKAVDLKGVKDPVEVQSIDWRPG
ncbi:MAG: adenylate/guanylate cyclase domain-containing protein [Acidimicrobiia bacterium]